MYLIVYVVAYSVYLPQMQRQKILRAASRGPLRLARYELGRGMACRHRSAVSVNRTSK